MLKENLFAIIAELLNVDVTEIDLTKKAEDINTWDSLAIINIALAIESEFDLPLSPEQIAEFYSIEYIYNLVNEGTK